MLPAVAQGALAIEARSADSHTLNLLSVLDNRETRIAVLAERACLRRLEGGCQVPIAVYTEVQPQASSFVLRGLVGAVDGSVVVRDEQQGSADNPEAAGLALAEKLLSQGAADLLSEQHTGEAGNG
jgi:hydroxymethylbilane synthase